MRMPGLAGSGERRVIRGALAVVVTLTLVLLVPTSQAAGTSALTLSPEKVDFGKQAMSSTSAAQTVTVSNGGSAAVGIYQVISSGVDFKQSNNCPQSLTAGASCTVSIVFSPAIDGTRDGAVLIFGNDSISPHTIVLMGVGE